MSKDHSNEIVRVKLDFIVAGIDVDEAMRSIKVPGLSGVLGYEWSMIRYQDGKVSRAWQVEERDGKLTVVNRAMRRKYLAQQWDQQHPAPRSAGTPTEGE